MSTQRVHYLDTIKGIGIILMIVTHSMSGPSHFGTWVFSFHMPLFFIVSGILFQMKAPGQNEFRFTHWTFVKQKAFSILVPYAFFSLLIILWQVLLSVVSHDGSIIDMVSNGVVRILSLRGMESLWFLPCLLLAELMFSAIYAYSPPKIDYFALGICFLFVILNVFANGKLPENIIGVFVRATMCCVFFAGGYFFGKIMQKFAEHKYCRLFGTIMILLSIPLSMKNGFSAIGNFSFGNVPLYYITAFLAVFGLIMLIYNVKNIPFVEYLGKNSIVLLCTNNLVIEGLRLLDYKLFGNWCLQHGIFGVIVFSACVFAIEIPIIQIGMKYFGVLFGKRNNPVFVSDKRT